MIFSLFYLLGLLALAHAAPQVQIGNTTLVGLDITVAKQDFFGGIPFAEPPIGDLRLRPTVLKTQLSVSTFDASSFGPGCLQPPTATDSKFSEDCLTINVYRPSGTNSASKFPVIFWTFGGGFDSGNSKTYNATAIVAQSMARNTSVIYVNFNYRLGPLGFPQGQEAADQGALNLALKDLIAALEWVQANIENFGGDKEKVTVFGQSSGAIMTAILFLNSTIGNLARAAIFESGSAASAIEFNASRREINWQNFVSGVDSCASLAQTGNTFNCLREANTSEILTGLEQSIAESPERYGFVPTIDGVGGLLPDIPSKLLDAGQFAHLPFIAGTNKDEGTMFAPPNATNVTSDLMSNYSPPILNPDVLQGAVRTLLDLYPDIPALGSPFDTGNETFGLPTSYKREAAIIGDLSFQSQRREMNLIASKDGVNTFAYLFTQPQTAGDPSLGVSHGSEVFFIYGVPPNKSVPAIDNLSKIMIDYWLSFVTSLNPNDGLGNLRPQWDQYTPQNQVVLQLEAGNTKLIPDDYRKEQIDFINSVPAVFHH